MWDGGSNIGSLGGLDGCLAGDGEEKGSESESWRLENEGGDDALSALECAVGWRLW